jgi:transcriptional regulator with XRE-family HTH domain
MPSDDWRQVGDAVRTRRLQLGLTQERAAELAGPSVSYATWRVLERVGRDAYREATLIGVCAALRWSMDSIDRILRGQPPIETPEDVPQGLSYRVVDAPEETVALIDRLGELVAELGRRAREGRL